MYNIRFQFTFARMYIYKFATNDARPQYHSIILFIAYMQYYNMHNIFVLFYR